MRHSHAQAYVEEVDSWFAHPEQPVPSNSRLLVFMAAVLMLGEPSLSTAELRKVHGYLTYLLRGWNPYTADICRSSFEDDYVEKEVFAEFEDAAKNLLDFTVPVKTSQIFCILTQFVRQVKRFGANITTKTTGERRTLLMLTIRLLSNKQELKIPNNILTVRACLSLYGRYAQLKPPTDGGAMQYATDQTLTYSSWLADHIERLLVISSDPIITLVNDFAYMAWFANVLRTARMMSGMHLDHHLDAVRTIIQEHVEQLTKFVEEYPLALGEQELERGPQKFLDVFGITPRKRIRKDKANSD